MYIKNFDSRISKSLNMNKKDVRSVLKELESVIHERILFGEDVSIRGVGKLSTKVSKQRRQFNVSKKTFTIIPPKMKLQFKSSSLLKEKLDKKTVYSESQTE